MFVVVGSSSAFTASSIINQCASSPTTTTTTYLVPEQGRQLVAFSQDYLAKKAKESASRASILRGSDPRSPSTNNTPNQGQGIGVAFGTASKNLVNRLLGHHEDHHQVVTDTSTTTKTTTTTTMNHANYLVWELMHAYTRQESEHYEDDILFHQIVD